MKIGFIILNQNRNGVEGYQLICKREASAGRIVLTVFGMFRVVFCDYLENQRTINSQTCLWQGQARNEREMAWFSCTKMHVLTLSKIRQEIVHIHPSHSWRLGTNKFLLVWSQALRGKKSENNNDTKKLFGNGSWIMTMISLRCEILSESGKIFIL